MMKHNVMFKSELMRISSNTSATREQAEKGFPFFRMGVIKREKVEPAINHNRRAIQAELDGRHGIDPTRTHLNYHLHGRETSDDVFYQWNGFYNDETLFGTKPKRKDAVWLNEIIISVSANDRLAHDPDRLANYFLDAYAWIKAQFNPEFVISFDVHLDEFNPHAHVLILPIFNGKMSGSQINNPFNQRRLRLLFIKEVGAKYGYKTEIVRLNSAQKEAMYSAVINELVHNPQHDAITRSPLFEILRDSVRADPQRYFEQLGLTTKIEKKVDGKTKHFVDHARSKGKGVFRK